MSSIEFPELSRMFWVTSVEGDATNLRIQAVIDDRSTLWPGEPHTAMIVVDRRRGEVQAPFVDSDVVLALRGM
jgi:hypothetical protein